MAAASSSAGRTGRPRKASTATPNPLPIAVTPTVETPTPSAAGVATSMPAPSLGSNGPMTPADCEQLAAQLTEPGVPMRRKLDIAAELRDSAESNRDHAFYEKYLAVFIPVLMAILGDSKSIIFIKENAEQRFRHALLNFLQRLPRNELFRPYEAQVMELMIKLLKIENEENALVCIKVLIDGFRAHKEQAEAQVEPFLELVKQLYTNMKTVVEKEISYPKSDTKPPVSATPAPSAPSDGQTPAGEGSQTPAPAPTPAPEEKKPPPPKGKDNPQPPPPPTILHRALHSPKVLIECPIAVVLIFQTYKTVVQPALLEFYPLVMDSIKLQPEPQRIAYEEAKAKGEIFVGVASGVGDRTMYADLIKAQVKTMAFIAYVLRGPHSNIKEYLEVFPEACVRLLRDCPPEDVGTRKELLIATRHILTVDSRSSFVPYIDTLLEERVLVGTGVTSRETLRPLAYSVVADLIHHVRNELPLAQLARIVYVFSCNLNDFTFTSSIQTMCAKLLNTIVDSIHNKGDAAESTRIMQSMFFSSLQKLIALTEAHDRLKVLAAHDKGKGKAKETGADADGDVTMEENGEKESDEEVERLAVGWREIEQAMPVQSVAYATESLDSFCKETRYLFKTLLHTFRTLLTYTRQAENPLPPPDGEILGQLFEHSLRCLAIFEGNRDPREAKEAVELLSQILLLFEPHVFSEIWLTHLDFFIQQSLSNPHVFPVLQMLITHESGSHQLVSILLKYLMTHLEEFGTQPKNHAALTLKLFKMSFLAINTYISTNESVLVPHLQKFIINSFTFAAKAPDPAIYYQILRALFRSIGGGRFEALYKEVLPILQEMLDTLAYLLEHASSDQERDMFVELTLTVPVRLTNLLPYLSYLMKPLVLALQGGTEQVSQGLRTLELCIDNLTADFLDPTMVPVLRDLMQALNRLLKPIPANRPHANAAVKILGKLGGRTRRFQEVEEQLDYRSTTSETAVHVTIEGKTSKLQLGYLVETADKAVEADLEEYREDGLQVLMVAAMAVLQEDGPLAEGNASFLKAMSGLYLACQEPGIKDKALDFVRDFCRRVFASEVARIDTRSGNTKATVEIGRKRYLPLTSAVADCFVDTFAMAKPAQREGLGDLLVSIVSDFREVAAGTTFGGKADGSRSVERMIQSFAHRFAALCHEEDWSRKMAGVAAIKVLVNRTEINRKLLLELEIDFVRAFIFCLRDAPQVAPSSATDVVELIKQLIRTCQGQEDGRARLPKLTETLVIELNSQSELCRTAVHECIELLAEVTGQPIPELIDPAVKSKVLDPDAGPIFSKPLRALPFAMQVGNIDAITYLMNLRPPFLDTSEEFVRLLHEVLALADVDDQSLLNKQPTLKQENWLKTLRVACLGLLRSAMGTADFLSKPNLAPVRSRIIQVYFKHVYSPSPEIVDIAHAGLRDVLEQQSKLPKDVLQAGLRPILVNLADAKRLSVPGLDGLARFLELLTNYFKVEIGVKLLEHFDTLGDAQMLQKAAYSPLDDNPDISRMTRLVNIFRLLPSTAIQYLKSLTSHVVDVEASLHQSAKGPFTENIAKYLDKYHAEGAQNLLDNIQNPRYIWTYRNIIQSGHAPQLVEELSGKAEAICDLCFKNPDEVDLVLPGLYIIRELSRTSPTWFVEQEPVLEALVGVWRSILIRSRDPKGDMSSIHYQQMPPLLLEMFMGFLRQQQHIALLFHVVEAYEIRSSFERSNIAAFLYEQVALQPSIEYRRDVVEQYFNLYEDESVTWAFKINALRLIVNPTVKVYFTDQKADGNDGKLISPQLIHRLDTLVWLPLTVTSQAKLLEDTLLIEIYQFTILLVQHAKDLIDKARKNIFKFAWMGVNILEPTIKLMAYVLTAQFMAILEHPDKFARLTWIGLLRLKDNDNRVLFRRALDTLAPILPTLQNKDHPPPLSGIPEWAQRVRTVLIEEGHATNQLVTVCELLVNHPDIFYPYRELYVPHVANSLNKLAFVQAASPELKKLSVDIVELIFKWEKRRMTARDEAMEVDEGGKRVREKDEAEPSPIKRQRIDRAGTAISASSGGGWAAPSQVRETMTAHLLRLVSSSPEPVARGGLTKRALDLFKEILGPKGLPNVHVKLGYFNRTMTQEINEGSINAVANSAEVIAAIAAVKDQNWVRSNLGTLRSLLEKAWVFDDSSLHSSIEDLTDSMFKELPENEEVEADREAKALLAFVSNAVNEGLVASLRSSSNLPGTLFLLRAWLKVQPQQLQNEAISSGLLKVLANLVKVHTTHTNNAPDPSYRLIISILDVLRNRLADIREQRKSLNSILSTLIDRSPNPTLCRYLLDLMRQWVLQDPEITSQGKEKAALLLRMAIFEQRDEQLFQKYLDLVYDVYETDALRGTDLTHRLEAAFLLGTKSKNAAQRARFLDKLEQSLPRSLDGRLQYLFSLQNWDTLADSYWIPQILSMLLAVVDYSEPVLRRNLAKVMDNDPVADMARNTTAADIIGPARNLIHLDTELAHKLWIAVFPSCWAALSRSQQTAFTPYVVKLLSKEYHRRQVEMRPNVIQTLLDGILCCTPPVTLPPLLVKYLSKTFGAWYVGFEILTKLSDVYRGDDGLRDSCSTALSELYAELGEDDMFYGLARSRCVYPETTAALTYEQNGLWPKAIEMYETAQMKARNGVLPFTEDEYCFWEDHWILAAQKLQNWESLTELARTDNDADLLLECAWRLSDWGSSDRETIEANIARVADVPTPRRKTFEAFTALLKAHSAREPPNDFLRILDEAQQVSLRKWVSLPSHVTAAHLPLLQMFQQCVELQEAAVVFDSLQMTNQQNLEMRVTNDLKQIFTGWRDRLPNFWDDISVWSDLLAWRQHVFQAVTKVYVPLIPQGETATYGYRGYHDTAWTINRFGEVARRHGLLDVCSVALNKIYSLPNIEISEAFLKLREQALCFFQKPDKFTDGLENISTTNLMYFAPPQKAEFLTLKGMFISRLGQNEEANAEFAHAIQMDMNLPKAWAEWGKFNDRIYRDRPETVQGPQPEPEPGKPKLTDEQFQASYARDRAVFASSAVSCYLQAAGLYNNHKSRALLLRVLWLLGLDDSLNTIAKAFENYKGDLVIWYWITLIPQLILSLSHREAKQARLLLMRIAKQYPQALFYQLRVSREDFSLVKRQHMSSRAAAARKAAEQAKAAAAAAAASAPTPASAPANGEAETAGGEAAPDGEVKEDKEVKADAKPDADGDAPMSESTPQPSSSTNANADTNPNASANDNPAPTVNSGTDTNANADANADAKANTSANANANAAAPGQPQPPANTQPPAPRQPWELVDEIMNVLKTAFPLLTLTMEKMVDQISIRAKPASDEDIYRFFAALLADALQQWGNRSMNPNDDGELMQATKDNLVKFSSNLNGELKVAIEKDFMRDTPKLREYIRRLQVWRDSYEKGLDARPRLQQLDQGGCNLIEFHHTKFDDVEIPGQYVLHIDHTEELVKIARFHPKAELARGHGHCFRRIKMMGSDGSSHSFSVQLPAARHCRREERLTQLFRIMNSVLRKRKEARRRNLQFHLPPAVPLAPQLRLVEADSSYISLQDIYDEYCAAKKRSREDSIMAFYDRLKTLYDPAVPRTDQRFIQLKTEVMEEIQTKMVPENILSNYMIRTMDSPESLWLMRKQFALQTAAISFLTYVCCLNNRTPNRFHLSRKTGMMYMTEILPSFAPGQALISSNESVPFRLTPNMQHFITRTGVEGIVTSAITAIARSLTQPEFDLGPTLQLFVRDELLTWINTYMKEPRHETLTKSVYLNVDHFIRRASTMGYIGENKDKAPNAPPVVHAVVTLLSQATSPTLLAQTNELFMPWY